MSVSVFVPPTKDNREKREPASRILRWFLLLVGVVVMILSKMHALLSAVSISENYGIYIFLIGAFLVVLSGILSISRNIKSEDLISHNVLWAGGSGKQDDSERELSKRTTQDP